MAVLDKLDYLNNALDLLADKDTYRPIPGNSINRQKNTLIQTLRNTKAQGRLNDYTYKRLNPTSAAAPQVLWSPQTYKQGTPRPLVSNRVAVIYGVAKELASITQPLAGQSPTTLGIPNIS